MPARLFNCRRTGLPLLLLIVLWTGRPAGASAQMPMGDYTRHEVDGPAVTVVADTSALRFIAYAPDVVRIDLLPSLATRIDSSLVVDRPAPTQRLLSISDGAGELTLSTSALTIRVEKTPVRVRVEDASGRVLLSEPDAAGVTATSARRAARFVARADERYYGTGQRGLGLDLRGERLTSYNRQVYGYGGPLATMNINVPLLLSSRGYALLFDDPYPGVFDLAASDAGVVSYEAEGGELSVYVMASPTVPGLLERYTWLTGRPPLPPKWALGYLQSKYGYRNELAARAVVDRLRAEDVPADALILDLYWFNAMGDLSWDRSAFPNPAQMIADFEAQGVKTILITEPYVTERSTNFSAFTSPGTPRAGQEPGGGALRIDNWFSCGCQAVLADFTHAPTRDWWWDRSVQGFLDDGVHGFWTDLGEPEAHPDRMQHTVGPARSVHNVFNLLWARMVAERYETLRPNRRVVNLTRSGYAGMQRYGTFTWSGDVQRSFGGLEVQIPIMLTTTLSGLYYHSSDLGGFVGSGTPELYMRWMQLGALTPVMRAHGVDNEPTEPWGFGTRALDVTRDAIELRYRMLPYLYTLAREAYDTGLPLVRPLFFADPDDPALQDVDDAFLLGEDLLVAPVLRAGQRRRTVQLPAGTWIDYWTGSAMAGGQRVEVEAPLDRLPLFVREGAVLPMRPEAPAFAGTDVPDTLQVVVYPDTSGSGTFSLYEDDGETRAYRTGAFARTPLSYTATAGAEASIEVTLGPAAGTFDGQPAARTYLADLRGLSGPPSAVEVDGRPAAERLSVADVRAQGGYAYDPARSRLVVQTTGPVDAAQSVTVTPARDTEPLPTDSTRAFAYRLGAPSPHPVQTETVLSYSVRAPSEIEIALYDVLGRRVATLVDARRTEGAYTVPLTDADLGALAGGTYFLRMTATRFGRQLFTDTEKLTIVR